MVVSSELCRSTFVGGHACKKPERKTSLTGYNPATNKRPGAHSGLHHQFLTGDLFSAVSRVPFLPEPDSHFTCVFGGYHGYLRLRRFERKTEGKATILGGPRFEHKHLEHRPRADDRGPWPERPSSAKLQQSQPQKLKCFSIGTKVFVSLYHPQRARCKSRSQSTN